MLVPRETFPGVLMRSELPRGMAELSGTVGLLTPNHGENPAGLSLPCYLHGGEGGGREDLLLLGMLSHFGCLVSFSLGAAFRPQT